MLSANSVPIFLNVSGREAIMKEGSAFIFYFCASQRQLKTECWTRLDIGLLRQGCYILNKQFYQKLVFSVIFSPQILQL